MAVHAKQKPVVPEAAPRPRPERGHRLTAAFEALEHFPALAESRDRVLELAVEGKGISDDLIEVIERDVAILAAVIRGANEGDSQRPVVTVREAVNVLGPEGVGEIVDRAATFDFLERTAQWGAIPDRFRIHGIATQQAALRIANESGWAGDQEALLVSSLLHDVGKLVLMHAYDGYPNQILDGARSPQERLMRERNELGVDHALVGGVLARRWGMPKSIASAIEFHHGGDQGGEASIIQLADLLVHYGDGADIAADEMLKASRDASMTVTQLRKVLYEIPLPAASSKRRSATPSPLSARESDVLRQLAKGFVYEQIAINLHLSTSTVRTHLHNIYGKLGVRDRAQAVLKADGNGWL